jgi:SAM-dependent methyltransferase
MTGTADLYDGFYDALDKDYVEEAEIVVGHVDERLPSATALLDVACGTGRHLEQFARRFRCTGVDLDPDMLAVARRRCGRSVRLQQGDMATLDLGRRRFDVVTCLFSSVAYMPTVALLRQAIAAMARHLHPGGVLLVEPWYTHETWEDGHLAVLSIDEPGWKAARVSRASRRGDLSALDFEFVVADRWGIRHFAERHELRLYTTEQYVDAFAAAGLVDVVVDPDGLYGLGLVVGSARR